MYISLSQLFKIILGSLGIATLILFIILFIILLIRFIKLINNINSLIDRNKENITTTCSGANLINSPTTNINSNSVFIGEGMIKMNGFITLN